MNWRVELSGQSERQLKRLPGDMQHRLARAIDELERDPFQGDVIPLKGRWHGRYRKRVGRYRIIFTPYREEHLVEISAIILRNERTYR